MEGGEGSSAAAAVVPESVMEAVKQTMSQLQELKPQLEEMMMSLAEPEDLAQMQPLQRAKAMYLLAEATTTIFTRVFFGCYVDGSVVFFFLQERLNVYREKLQRCMDQSKEPLRPTTVLNRQAATRVIEHSLPDLTSDQKQNMRDLSQGEKSSMASSETTAKKRKYQSNEKQSVQSNAKEFIEKAARELNGNTETGLKGPVMAAADDSDDAERVQPDLPNIYIMVMFSWSNNKRSSHVL
ncbi:unnamed protein product [Eruca vesicaria subsp. sativa]|uniref:Nuclear nucleic acid-binding protein C1D n=1 Tax=Eruca vesicaria subsp. sativa TaxID=29727 RepID=A0ABC8JBY7_ERUVS|nr:unnamed protein product [Eruca vesicaria subsp. sativa]